MRPTVFAALSLALLATACKKDAPSAVTAPVSKDINTAASGQPEFRGGHGHPLRVGWYKGNAVAYFSFEEAMLASPGAATVPTSPIYVLFNNNAAGPASGFRTEPGTVMTRNVLATSPGDVGYSPLWSVRVLNNSHFASVTNLTTAASFPAMAAGIDVNCPVVR